MSGVCTHSSHLFNNAERDTGQMQVQCILPTCTLSVRSIARLGGSPPTEKNSAQNIFTITAPYTSPTTTSTHYLLSTARPYKDRPNASRYTYSPIEKAWNAPKERVKKRPCWNDEMVMELAEERWASIKKRQSTS